ncbi:MAG: Na+:solute symporter [Planctomycetes bacterium]|nr:Na+:solute symporter [Planctomycetota bacterium]
MGILNGLDWAIILAYLTGTLVLGLVFTRRASKGVREFFISGGALPWWLVGTSMVATTFSTDTPNLVCQLTREGGVAGNWRWWCFVLTGIMTVFLFARLWRRSGVLTDIEFYELRYSGKPAAFIRAFRAAAVGVLFNILIMASVTLAATKIAHALFGWPKWMILGVCGLVTLIFSAFSGFWGVVVTDLFLFVVAMIGAVSAAVFAVGLPEVGGLHGLFEKLPDAALRFVPSTSDGSLFLSLIILPFAVQWWSVWYPGAEPGGGSYVAQRMFGARDEKHSLLATFWFNIAHYAVRPWPWIIVALASIVVFPTVESLKEYMASVVPTFDANLVNHDIAYPLMLRRVLPHGFLGIVVASLVAAYMSTIDTHLNLGASYILNDIYKRFFRRDASERHYILVSRIATVLLMLAATAVSLTLESAAANFDLIIGVFAGTGLVYILRWYWWRVSAWSEITAMVSAIVLAVGLIIAGAIAKARGFEISSDARLLLTALPTTAIWLIVTFLTRPTPRETLVAFYRKIRPLGPGWKPIAALAPEVKATGRMASNLAAWAIGVFAIYAALFGVGLILYGRTVLGVILCAGAVAGVAAILRVVRGDFAEA